VVAEIINAFVRGRLPLAAQSLELLLACAVETRNEELVRTVVDLVRPQPQFLHVLAQVCSCVCVWICVCARECECVW
jgi:hypothetical protein